MEKIIELTGRIDSTNSNKLEEEILKAIENYKGEIIFDAKKLDYISSAGLRVILNIKKKNDETKVINCKPEIYEIFDMTGFVEMMDISKAYREISIENCEKIGEGANGIVYRIDPETIVKVYKKEDAIDDIKHEIELARKAFVMGIPTAIPYDIVKVDKLYGSVFELLNATSFTKLVNDGENVDELVKKSIVTLKAIHNTMLKPNELPSKNKEAIKWAEICAEHLPKKIGEKLVKLFKGIPETNNMLHGDYHTKNILLQKNEIILIDMDTLSMGNPIFEFAVIFGVYKGYECVDENNPSKFIEISKEKCNEIWEKTFKYYFEDKDEKYIQSIIDKAKIISYTLIMKRKLKRQDEQYVVEFCKKYLTENVPKIDNLYF